MPRAAHARGEANGGVQEEAHRGRPAARRHQPGVGAGEIDPARASEHAASVVGATTAGRGAVIFAQMVDDPSGYADVLLSDPKRRRAAMRALKRRRSWSGTACSGSSKSWSSGRTPPTSRCWNGHGPRSGRAGGGLAPRTRIIRAPREIFDRHRLPAFHDPLAGGGALPLEAQRLGLEAHASDDGVPLRDGGTGATAYADAVGVYLGITVSRLANRHAFLSFWDPMRQTVQLGLCPSGSADDVGSLRRQSVQRFQRQLA